MTLKILGKLRKSSVMIGTTQILPLISGSKDLVLLNSFDTDIFVHREFELFKRQCFVI